ncbi:MAG: methylmalonyl-CoA mutase family protein [Longimonas sp.]|uniref:methylmalonyl-CoA mutase family protein n=1 Tax=Longimonas sp. TaxID=2039626 RepID=UPI003353FDDB
MTDASSLTFDFPPTPDAAWLDQLRSDLGDDFEDQLTWQPLEGIDLCAFYRRASTEPLPHVDRSAHGDRLRAAPNDWTIAQRLPLDAPHLLERIAKALDGGAERIVVHASSQAVQQTVQGDAHGLPLSSLRDGLAAADADGAALHLDGGPSALALAVQLRDEIPAPLLYVDPSMQEAFSSWSPAAASAYTDYHAPEPGPLVVDARLPHRAGLPLVDELALALASASETLARQGADALDQTPHVLAQVDTSYFLEIAKLRALRLLLPQVFAAYADLHGSGAALAPAQVELYVETSPRSHTLFDPHANLLRAATQGAAAVIGGADQLVVAPFRRDDHDETANADRLARNTQLILKHEAHLHRVADPAAGAYYLEHATDRLAHAAWSRFQSIEEQGGLTAWAATGALADAARAARSTRRERIAHRRDVLVGTNHYPDPDAPVTPPEDGSPQDSSSDGAHRIFDIDPPGWARLLRRSDPYDALRLRVQQLDERPRVLVCPVGTPSMRSARATFARNIVGCLGVALIEPLGYDTVGEALAAVEEHAPDAVVWCADDDTLADLLQQAPTGRLDAVTLAAAPPHAVPDDGAVDLLLHRRAPTLQRLTSLTDALVERTR